MTVLATSLGRLPDPTAKRSTACARCGHIRKDARANSPICRDCKDVLTPEQQIEWGARPDYRYQAQEVAA